jgi:hypothetical protein
MIWGHKGNIDSRIAKMQERMRKLKEAAEANPRYQIEQLLQDIRNLEKYYADKEYRDRLLSAFYPSSESVELESIYEQEKKVKEKLNLPQNSLIRYEKVKCAKDCEHNTPPHQYYYAYVWDSDSKGKKLKKKYIGKQLPLPSFQLTD